MKSIKGITVEKIASKTMRNWAVSLGIQMKKNFRKSEIIKCIITTKNFRERIDTGSPIEGQTAPRVHINNVRFINVLAQDGVKALLLQRGVQKTREDLELEYRALAALVWIANYLDRRINKASSSDVSQSSCQINTIGIKSINQPI